MIQGHRVCLVYCVYIVYLRRHTGPTVALARRTECTGPWCWGSSWRLTCPCARCCLCQCCFFLTQIALNFIFFFQDLIQSELAGLAFDSLQQVFRKQDIENMYAQEPLPLEQKQTVFVIVDPAAGGPSSDYAIVSLVRSRGNVQVILDTKILGRCPGTA